jgi:hypothetical protein
VPKLDTRAEPYLRAEVSGSALGVRRASSCSGRKRPLLSRGPPAQVGRRANTLLCARCDAKRFRRRAKTLVSTALSRTHDVSGPPQCGAVLERYNDPRSPGLLSRVASGRRTRCRLPELRIRSPACGRRSRFGGSDVLARQILSFAPTQKKLRIRVPFRRLAHKAKGDIALGIVLSTGGLTRPVPMRQVAKISVG